MECPGCGKRIVEPAEKCGSCGYVYSGDVFARISLCFDLRKDLEKFRSTIKNDIWPDLNRMSEKIAGYEKLLNRDLENLRAQAGEIMPEPVEIERMEVPPSAEIREAPSARPETLWQEKTAAIRRLAEDSSLFEVNVGQKWLLIIGIVTMVFGVGYFLKYSFERGWIGPAGRVAMAYIWGIAFVLGGDRFRKRFETYGLYLMGGGIATLYFATFAGFQIYHLFPQGISFLVMILITVLAGTLSIVYDTKWLAVLGLLGGFLTPVMLGTAQDNQTALMTYMTILNLGLLGIAFSKKWDLLNILGFVFTYLLYAAWYLSHYETSKFWPSIIFLNIFYLIYSIIPFAYQFFREEGEKARGFLIITPNSFIAFGFSYYMITGLYPLEWVGVITVFYAVVFLLMASYLFVKGMQEGDAFVVLAGKSALFLVITIPVIFSKHWITVFWAAQAITLLWMGIRLSRKSLYLGAYLLLAIAAGKLVLYDYPVVFGFSLDSGSMSCSYTSFILERAVTSAFVLLVTFGFGRLVERTDAVSLLTSFNIKRESAVPGILLGILLFIILNIETSAFFHEYLAAARFAAISVLWAVFSVALMLRGFRINSPVLRKLSLGLFLATLVKVFRFDMSNVSTPYRIISFIILGLMLVGTSYLYYRFKDRIMDAMSDDAGEGRKEA
jgi:uncharacterized membrane protein